MKSLSCLNPECRLEGKVGSGSIVRHGFYRTTYGRRRPLRRVRKDVLFDQGHAVLPSSPSASYVRCGRRPKRRGCEHFCDCSSRRDCLEHGRPLARKGSPSVSSIQPRKDHRIRGRGAASRRDSRLRLPQGPADVGLRRDRSLVSALAIDGDRKTKLPEHSGARSRRLEANEFSRTFP